MTEKDIENIILELEYCSKFYTLGKVYNIDYEAIERLAKEREISPLAIFSYVDYDIRRIRERTLFLASKIAGILNIDVSEVLITIEREEWKNKCEK